MTEFRGSEVARGTIRKLPGRRARAAAAVFNIGNVVAILVPIPLGMLWFGLAVLVYAVNRHHPNRKVGHYTRRAAYRFYAIAGLFVAAVTFIPGGGWNYYLAAWALAVLILVPWSIFDLVRIHRDHWEDIDLTGQNNDSSSHP
jgi:hypothetical protein